MTRSLALGHAHGLAASSFDGVTAWGTDSHGTLGQGQGNWQKLPVKKPKVGVEVSECGRVEGLRGSAGTREGGGQVAGEGGGRTAGRFAAEGSCCLLDAL